MSAPASSRWVAKLCRSVCGLVRGSRPACARYFSSSRPTLRDRQPGAVLVQEQRRLLAPTGGRRRPRARPATPGAPPGPAAPSRASRSLLALAAHRGEPPSQVQVLEVQAGQLADAQAGRVERFQHGPVAQAERRRRPAGPSSSRSMSSRRRKCGSFLSWRGPRRPSAGLTVSTPWRHRKRNHERTAARRRAMVVLA